MDHRRKLTHATWCQWWSHPELINFNARNVKSTHGSHYVSAAEWFRMNTTDIHWTHYMCVRIWLLHYECVIIHVLPSHPSHGIEYAWAPGDDWHQKNFKHFFFQKRLKHFVPSERSRYNSWNHAKCVNTTVKTNTMISLTVSDVFVNYLLLILQFVKLRRFIRHKKNENSALLRMSQRMTFLYSPRLGNRSSRPVTKPTAMISKAWRPCGMSNLDRMIAPLRVRVDTVSYLQTCMVRPSEMTLYKEAYLPLARSQPLTHESFTTLDLAETSALDCTWHVVPFEDESTIVLVACLSVVKEPGEGDFTWTVITTDSCGYFTACNRSRWTCLKLADHWSKPPSTVWVIK